MRLRALTLGVGLMLAACAVGTEPLQQLNPLSSGGGAGDASAGGNGAAAGSGEVAAGGGAGGDSGAGAIAGSGGVGGSAAGAGGMGGAAGAGGQAGTGGQGGNGGQGGMPAITKPTSITVSGTKNATPRQAPSAGGGAHTDDCPAGQVLIGFIGTIDGGIASLRSVQGVCGTLKVAANAPYAITTMQAGTLPVRDTAGNTVENAMCPANQVIVGFSGRQAMYIEALIFRCAPLSISGNAPSFKLDIGNAGNSPTVGGENAGNTFNAINCAAGEVAVSQMPNTGSAVDSFGLRCAALSLVVN